MGFIRRLARNWKLKTLAFALAVLLWTVISADQVTTNWLTVPLEVRVADPGYQALTTTLPTEVEVRVSGTARDLLGLAFRPPLYVLAVTGIESQVETRTLEPRMLQVPRQMQVEAIEVRPASLRLEFTRVGIKRVPVRAQITSSLGDRWAVVDTLRGEPSMIELSGPRERLSGITEILTLPLELTERDTLIDRIIALDTTGLGGLRLSVETVRITGRVDRVSERTISDVPIQPHAGVTISPDRVKITLRGAGAAVRRASPTAVRVGLRLDLIPPVIPAEGLVVSLRLLGVPSGLTAIMSPGQVRIYPPEGSAGTLPPGLPPLRDTVISGDPPGPE